MTLSDITNSQFSQLAVSVNQSLCDTITTTVPLMDAGTLTSLLFDWDVPLDLMDVLLDSIDPCMFPAFNNFSSLDEDYPAINTIPTSDDFTWCFRALGDKSLDAIPQSSQLAQDGTIPDVSKDEDEDEHCTGVTVAIDTSHWQHASLNTEGMSTMWAQRHLDHPVLPVQTRRGNVSKETCRLQGMQAEERWRDLVHATNDAKHEIEEKDKLLPGQTPKTLAEIQTLVKEDMEMANWSKETQEQMMQRVHEIHAIKAQGACVSNHAASVDYWKTVNCIEQELSNLAPRTGAMSIALFTQAS
ncbi:hypothetical protein ARMGADRAFT_1077637 [Armillaria gallica]|uniref:Uncharacterized protein n=1 Tax=Armillaria gallica TaxID=47427 RepID=A0A2H3E6D5_ARMGA|nr:hypothetical protein ARMGADRAFT_1077637 [Armillaria gallica]